MSTGPLNGLAVGFALTSYADMPLGPVDFRVGGEGKYHPSCLVNTAVNDLGARSAGVRPSVSMAVNTIDAKIAGARPSVSMAVNAVGAKSGESWEGCASISFRFSVPLALLPFSSAMIMCLPSHYTFGQGGE